MGQMGQKKRKIELVEEYLGGGMSLREMERKYGVSSSSLQRWVKELERGKVPKGEVWIAGRQVIEVEAEDKLPTEVRELQRELKEARLYNELLNAMIDIAEDQMGIEIRKKSGARQRRS